MKKFINPELALRSLHAANVISTSDATFNDGEMQGEEAGAPGRQAGAAPAPAANADINPERMSN